MDTSVAFQLTFALRMLLYRTVLSSYQLQATPAGPPEEVRHAPPVPHQPSTTMEQGERIPAFQETTPRPTPAPTSTVHQGCPGHLRPLLEDGHVVQDVWEYQLLQVEARHLLEPVHRPMACRRVRGLSPFVLREAAWELRFQGGFLLYILQITKNCVV